MNDNLSEETESVAEWLLGVRGRPDRVYHIVGRCVLLVAMILLSWRYYALDMRGLTWQSDFMHLIGRFVMLFAFCWCAAVIARQAVLLRSTA
jgi:hypothetical protein